jgi:hypothetical protein
MSVKHNTFSILSTCVVLESTTIKTSLFTKSRDPFAIVVSETIHLENAFSHIRCTHEVNLKQFGLKMTFIRAILNKSLKKEGCCLLNTSILKENLDNAIN